MKQLLYLLLITLGACTQQEAIKEIATADALIPTPQQLQRSDEYTAFEASLSYFTDMEAAEIAIRNLADYLKGNQVTLVKTQNEANADIIIKTDSSLSAEAYTLSTKNTIQVRAIDGAGVFYAFQTLKQLIPINNMAGKLAIPAVQIEDAPTWSYRGTHLDVSRHFFSVAYIKKFLDLLSQYKINHFHWHLTDDQGWRIEIKKYPRLHTVGGFRSETLMGHVNDTPPKYDGKRHGGFYTQEEIRDIVRYANERYITIIPEIDLPGHSSAILAAYPEYGCKKDSFYVKKSWGIFEEVLCPYPETFTFLKDVLTEVMDLFPGQYIHLGGDEVLKKHWEQSSFCKKFMRQNNLKDVHEIESYFFNELAKFVLSKGKRPIGWDEITAFPGLQSGSIAMIWRSEDFIQKALDKNIETILTPSSHLYLDYYQSMHPDEPLAIGGYLPLNKVYAFDPLAETRSPQETSLIKGIQANIWTEYMPNTDKLEYMALPRLLALAEIAWTNPKDKDYQLFQNKVIQHFDRLKTQGFSYANSFLTPQVSVDGYEVSKLSFSSMPTGVDIRYTTNGALPDAKSPIAEKSISLMESTAIIAQSFNGSEKVGFPVTLQYSPHKWTAAKVNLQTNPSPKYLGSGPTSFVNGVQGSDNRFGDLEWLGFEGNNLEATLELSEAKQVDSIRFRYFYAALQWIYPPKAVEIWYSLDGDTYLSAGRHTVTPNDELINEVAFEINAPEASHWRITIENNGIISKGKPGEGHQAFLFIDEVSAH